MWTTQFSSGIFTLLVLNWVLLGYKRCDYALFLAWEKAYHYEVRLEMSLALEHIANSLHKSCQPVRWHSTGLVLSLSMLSFSGVANVAEGFWQYLFSLAHIMLREMLAAQAVHIINAKLSRAFLFKARYVRSAPGLTRFHWLWNWHLLWCEETHRRNLVGSKLTLDSVWQL